MAPIVPIIPINRIKGVWTEGDVVLKNPIGNFVDSRLILNFEKQEHFSASEYVAGTAIHRPPPSREAIMHYELCIDHYAL